MTIEERLERLERRNRRGWLLAAAAVVLAYIAGGLVNNGPSPAQPQVGGVVHDHIATRLLSIVDDDRMTRIQLNADKDEPSLWFFNKRGTGQLGLGLGPTDDGAPTQAMEDEWFPVPFLSGSYLMMFDPKGTSWAHLKADDLGMSLSLKDQAAEVRLGTGETESHFFMSGDYPAASALLSVSEETSLTLGSSFISSVFGRGSFEARLSANQNGGRLSLIGPGIDDKTPGSFGPQVPNGYSVLELDENGPSLSLYDETGSPFWQVRRENPRQGQPARPPASVDD